MHVIVLAAGPSAASGRRPIALREIRNRVGGNDR